MGKIYKITNTVSRKVYIGKTNNITRRMYNHLLCVKQKVNRCLYDAINKYGWDTFYYEILEECSPEVINDREKFYISLYKSTDTEFGYNMTSGGDGGNTLIKWSEDAKQQLWRQQGQKRIGHTVSTEGRQRISQSKIGNLNPSKRKEVREKISATLARKYREGEISLPPNPTKGKFKEAHHFYGKHHTEATKQTLSQYRKGKKLEDIVGEKEAKRIKQLKSDNFLGKNNPLYKNINWEIVLPLILQNIKIADIAKMIHVSAPTLLCKFKTMYGKTVRDYKKDLYGN